MRMTCMVMVVFGLRPLTMLVCTMLMRVPVMVMIVGRARNDLRCKVVFLGRCYLLVRDLDADSCGGHTASHHALCT
jgi:hypothetical protein